MYDPKDSCLLESAIAKYEELVNSPYLYELTHFSVCSSHSSCPYIGFLKVQGFPASTTFGTFSYVLNALASLNITIGYYLQVSAGQLFIYIGIKGQEYDQTGLEILNNGLLQTFPDIQITMLSPEENIQLLDELFHSYEYTSLATISVVPDAPTTSILTTFNKLMGMAEDYVLFLLATPVSRCTINFILSELMSLYDTLSGFIQRNHSTAKSLSKNSSHTIIQTTTETNGNSSTETNSSGNANNMSQYTNITPSTSLPLPNNRSLGISVLCNKGSGCASNESYSMANGCTNSESFSYCTHCLHATNRTDNTSLSFTIQNKYVMDAIARLNVLISRYNTLLSLPTFQFGAYFLAPKLATTTRGAYTYLGSTNASSNISPMVVNLWDTSSKHVEDLLMALQNFHQPTFKACSTDECVSSTTFISGIELTNTLYFT